MSGVGLVRDGTLLYWRSLVTEVDPGLVDRAATALREAPQSGVDGLGAVSPGGPTPATDESDGAGESPTADSSPVVDEPLAADDLDPATAVGAVRRLAGRIGPREATSAAYDRAARWVAGELTRFGYYVERQRVDVPAGESWGVAVPAGRSTNVVATPADFDPSAPHLVVGAHLDTVPQAPGAEDNASGVGVLLAVAEAVAVRRTRLPVVFVAFGAEEPRGPSDDDHHYGSRRYVAKLTPLVRNAVRGMVSLDRVGVGQRVPVGSAGDTDPVQRELLAAARRAGAATVAEDGQRSSDHWSFVRAGLPGARLGSTPYAGYHSAGDVPAVVSPAQLERVGRIVAAWLAPR
ncbi:M28 family peptidase [Nocardioides cavernae]|uniref:M28 family peptidase n=2 Tax=Nocardioides cavernae TaxID=1921566 RepID=A0ABR8NCM1_9ACTN|nr:M28 family peptidase [Nocardioides cavernae]